MTVMESRTTAEPAHLGPYKRSSRRKDRAEVDAPCTGRHCAEHSEPAR